jgi:Tfp pilus assembly protein PilO
VKSSTKRILSILLAIVLLVASVFVYIYMIKPIYGEVSALRDKVVALNQTLDNYEGLNKKFQEIFTQYQNLGDLEKQLSMIFPSKLDAAYAVSQVSGIAKKNRLEFLSLTTRQLAVKPGVGPVKGIGTLRMEIKLAGAYEDFKNFLKDTETNIMLSELVNLRIEKQKVGKSETLYTLTIDAYYQAE